MPYCSQKKPLLSAITCHLGFVSEPTVPIAGIFQPVLFAPSGACLCNSAVHATNRAFLEDLAVRIRVHDRAVLAFLHVKIMIFIFCLVVSWFPFSKKCRGRRGRSSGRRQRSST